MTEPDVDQLCELANIGAGHAASAFAQLTDATIRMRVPQVRMGDDVAHTDEAADSEWSAGIFFELDGYVHALVGLLFRKEMCDALVRRLLGAEPGTQFAEMEDSALMEVGNILASHVASAIADTVGVRLLPSIPILARRDAAGHLEALVAERESDVVRIDSELIDDSGELGALLVLVASARK